MFTSSVTGIVHFSSLVYFTILCERAYGGKTIAMLPVSNDPECHLKHCPETGSEQWSLLQDRCCLQGGIFHCQTNNGKSVQMCTQPIYCPAGTFANISQKALFIDTLCQPCMGPFFQPYATPSHVFTRPQCQQMHATCPEMNSIIARSGNRYTDSLCMCDHRKGFRPVPRDNNNCSVFYPSSGCTCEYDPCPGGQSMSPLDYRCHVIHWFHPFMIQKSSLEEDINGEFFALCWTTSLTLWTVIPVPADGVVFVPYTFVTPVGIPCETNCDEIDMSAFFIRTLSFLHQSYGLIIPIALAFVACILVKLENDLHLGQKLFKVFERLSCPDDDEKRNIAVRVKFNSKHVSQTAFQEVKNILPLLARCYGPMSLAYNSTLKYITVLVQPGDLNYHFDLTVFIRDLLSSASLKNKIATSRSGLASDVTITVLYTLSSSLQVIDSEYSSLNSLDNLQPNSGNIRFKLTSNQEEISIVGKLLNDRKQLTKIFFNHKLKFLNVHQGSIVVKFELQSDSGIMNSLAWETRVKAIAKDLFSTESLRGLASEQDIQVEFVCKAKLDSYQVVQAENLAIQIGSNNTITVCCHRHSDQQNDRDENEVNDGVQYVHATGDEDYMGEFISLNVIQFSRIVRNNPDEIPRRDADLEANTKVTKIVVNCNNVETASILRNEWHNVLSLIQYLHPGCTMSLNGSQVEWHLPFATQDSTLHFLKNIFCIEHIRSALGETSVEVIISVERGTQGRQPVGTTEDGRRSRRISDSKPRFRIRHRSHLHVLFENVTYYVILLYTLFWNKYGDSLSYLYLFILLLIICYQSN